MYIIHYKTPIFQTLLKVPVNAICQEEAISIAKRLYPAYTVTKIELLT